MFLNKTKLVWEKVNNKYYSRYCGAFNIIVSFTVSKKKKDDFKMITMTGDIGVYPNYTHKFHKAISYTTIDNLPICFKTHDELFQTEAEIILFNFLKELERKCN